MAKGNKAPKKEETESAPKAAPKETPKAASKETPKAAPKAEVNKVVVGARKAVGVLVKAGVLAESNANALYNKIRKNLT